MLPGPAPNTTNTLDDAGSDAARMRLTLLLMVMFVAVGDGAGELFWMSR